MRVESVCGPLISFGSTVCSCQAQGGRSGEIESSLKPIVLVTAVDVRLSLYLHSCRRTCSIDRGQLGIWRGSSTICRGRAMAGKRRSHRRNSSRSRLPKLAARSFPKLQRARHGTLGGAQPVLAKPKVFSPASDSFNLDLFSSQRHFQPWPRRPHLLVRRPVSRSPAYFAFAGLLAGTIMIERFRVLAMTILLSPRFLFR